MKNIIEMIRGFFKQHKELRKSRSIILALAAVVVFATTYALILPALTLDEDAAAETPGITVEGEALTGDAAEVTADEQAAANAAAAEAAAEEQAAPEEPVAEAAVEEPAAEAVPEEAAPAETALAEAAAEEGQAAETQPSLDAETAETDGMQTETEEPKEEAALITEPTTLEVRGNGCTIRVAFDGTALLPVGVQLQVHEITKDNDPEAYQSYFDRSQAKVKEGQAPDTDTVLTYARFFDISFIDASGTEVEPSAAVDVRIVYDSDHAVDAGSGEDVGAVHFNEETNTTDEIKTENKPSGSDQDKVAEVGFQAENFSVYGVVGTLTTHYIGHKGTKYEVTVEYGPEAKIPEGATLSVTDIEEGTEEYERARKAVLADKQANGEEIVLSEFGFAALDISIMYEGKEIEPEAPVKVDFRIKSLPNVENLDEVLDSIEIQHHVETGNKVAVVTVYDGGNAEATFDVATNEEVIREGNAIDPNSYKLPDENVETLDEIDTPFITEAFSTYTISWGNPLQSYNIHYVDTNGNSLTPTITPEFTNNYKFLIYDVAGYEYDSTHYGSLTGTAIKPLLQNYNGDRIYLDNNNDWRYLRDDIYVVYKAKTDPTPGGTVTPSTDEEWPEGGDAPQFSKSSIGNGNGTNTVSLSIEAAEKVVENATKANVIVVFDVSGSMSEDLNGQSRLRRAKTAINNMADVLLSKKDSAGNQLVKMGLVTFSTTANVDVSLTDAAATDAAAYKQQVNAQTAGGGTNWEQALYLANRMTVDSDAATFIVFVTDGDPTFRVSRGEYADSALDLFNNGGNNPYQYYKNNYVFGAGNGTLNQNNNIRNFDAAVAEGTSIIDSGKNFYAIGVSSDVTSVQNLVTQSGGKAENAYLATDATALDEAFQAIAGAISSTLGFGNVAITDGITSLSSAEIKAANADPSSFKYYRSGGDYGTKTEWTTREADGCGAASYDADTGAVQWNMGETFQLEDGVTYTVEFIVWPSQDAYDLVADLNNGLKLFANLTQGEKDQVVEVTPPTYDADGNMLTTGTYALKTNTNTVNATYNKTSQTGDTVTVSDETDFPATYTAGTIENMSLDSTSISVKKIWNNQLDARTAQGVGLTLTKDGAEYLTPVTVNMSNDWTSDDLFISAGMITHASGTTGTYTIREPGHEYTITEPAEFSYYWDLKASIYRPMVIDGTLEILVKTDSPTGTEGTDYFVMNGSSYQKSDGSTQLTATNDRRSRLNLIKTVTTQEGAVDIPDPDALFTYTITVTDATGGDVWFSAATGAGTEDDPHVLHEIPNVSSNVVAEMNTSGELTKYYYVPSGQEFTISIKAGWNVRFLNLPTGSTYSIQETGMDEGFEFVNAAAQADNGGIPGTVNGNTVSGTIDIPNNDFDVSFTNRWLTKEIDIIKVDENGDKLGGAKFTLTKGQDGIAEFTSNTSAPETIGLGKGIYCLTETVAPDGYIILSNKIYFKVNPDGTVVLCNEAGETEVEYGGGTTPVTYDNASVSNPPDVVRGTVSVSNEPGTELPNTGGSGTLLYTMSGFALICAAALLYGFRMRRRERRFR